MKYAEVEVEVELDDILDYINYDASESDLEKIKENLKYIDDVFFANNLYDREKILILKDAMKKYNLEELIEKLGIIQGNVL